MSLANETNNSLIAFNASLNDGMNFQEASSSAASTIDIDSKPPHK